MSDKIKYIIWSIERRSWCTSNTKGYTFVLGQAGRYSRDQAAKIISDANREGEIFECVIAPECNEMVNLSSENSMVAD